MDTLQAITTRRSVRSFRPDPVDREQIDKLMHAAMHAPSAHNEQPWHFIIIDERKILDEIPKIHPYSKMLLEAPLAVCVCADLTLDKMPGTNFWVQDCSAATQNILLASCDLGLGSCWLGLYPHEERILKLRAMLNLPETVTPFSIIALGYPQTAPKQPASRYKANRVHENRW